MSVEIENKISLSGEQLDQCSKPLVTVASVFEVMSKVTPDINNLLETNMISIAESFTKIAESGRKLQEEVKTAQENQSSEVNIELLKEGLDNINSHVSQAIIGMQFQDRLSQNLVILKDVSCEVRNYINSTLEAQGGRELDVDFAKSILALIKLGEIRDIYINDMVSHGYIKGPEDLDYEVAEAESDLDIELF